MITLKCSTCGQNTGQYAYWIKETKEQLIITCQKCHHEKLKEKDPCKHQNCDWKTCVDCFII